ncbi:Solute carrier family 28 member 3 [Acropora cervicornis]|uniref:Solute carrier family 28 member 3 n=1 Tax=Acropora cervicornis TaxID=6130 RepID=A0AAD9R1A9_ACRCE|nr:Solute carrier family 28 member 3 [Acropora cervicornis]
MESPPKHNTGNLEDSGCIDDGFRIALSDGDENTFMLDQLDMSGTGDSKHQSKPSLKGDADPEGHCFHVMVAKWDESPEGQKWFEVWKRHSLSISILCITTVLLIYSIVAIALRGFETAQSLFGVTMFLSFCMTYKFVRDHWGSSIYKACMEPVIRAVESQWRWLKWVFLFLIVVALAVKWRPVLWGLALQFIFGLLILRTSFGFKLFSGLGEEVAFFLDYSDVGAAFVFGPTFKANFFAFKVLPTVIFFSSFISVCYYLGIMQLVVKKIAWLMQITMKTSAVESLNAAGNIFIGQTEAPLLVRPFLEHVTMSELHAIMTGGFATIAGGVLAAYVGIGVSASHLLSASVMSAPAALAISKLMYPETEIPESLNESEIEIPEGTERNVIEAAAKGASTAIALVANIAANIIAFLAFLAFFNGVLSWIGSMVGHPEFSFEIRSEIIATYALCGFSNFASIGIQIGGMGPLAPSRKEHMAAIALRTLAAGTIACLMTACVADSLRNYRHLCPVRVFEHRVYRGGIRWTWPHG